ncbi:gamma-aminobutyric acid receptor subunit alpha-5 [Hyalella azteca]|uniref:Gamma-aminobutyric acid receptor subunit alpha-5 n=1 Tax=Hyalella azteca TaxID=294128 RepID=A0A979FYH3_HYAAZ|nr:gamma-aminobutyric acid receptor subunit alpha-5 [Hyalella azteca]
MNLLIRSMGPITEKDMKYSMDCYLRQEWHDERLTFKGPLPVLTLNIKMLEALWKPDTFFHNGLGSYIHMITRPNKLFRITQDGRILYSMRITQDGRILYSMRLTIKAKCPMELRNFPMDKQSCPLIISSYAYPEREVRYEWDNKLVTFEAGMTLSQFDLLNTKCTNYSAGWRTDSANYSILQVNFNLQRHTGYFLIQVYVPCFLIVVLSWVSFWLNREATSDRVGLGITTVLTLSTISLDSRTDLPKVHYATALDWFILMSFAYCMATLLQCAGVHYFTKVGSGEALPDGEWQDIEDTEEDIPASTIRRMLTRPRTINSFGMDECGSSVIGLSSVLLVDDGPAISQYRGVRQPAPPNLSVSTETCLSTAHRESAVRGYHVINNIQPEFTQGNQQEVCCDDVQAEVTSHGYQDNTRVYTSGEMDRNFFNTETNPPVKCQSCESQYSSQNILLDSNNRLDSYSVPTQSSAHLDTVCEVKNCAYGQTSFIGQVSLNKGDAPMHEQSNGETMDLQSKNFKPLQQQGKFASFYASMGSSNITALSETSIQNQRNAETQTSKKEGFWFQLTRCVVGSESYRRAREREATVSGSVNSVSRIDELSRILFPVSYGLLNLWYWYSYYDAELINS